MRRLYLVRHAKSSWDDPALSDFERPLNGRGESAAPFMGEVLSLRGYSPQLIVSSPAKRAARTAILVKEASGVDAEVRFDDRIYEASPNTLRQVVAGFSDSLDSVMLVGHNPGMEGFLRFLTCRLEPMPTAALAVIDLAIDGWGAADADRGSCVEVIRPKDEMRAAKFI